MLWGIAHTCTYITYIPEEAGQPSHDNFFNNQILRSTCEWQTPKIFQKGEVVAVIFGFLSFYVQRIELEFIPMVWCEDILFQESSFQKWVYPKYTDFFFCILRDHQTAFVSPVLHVGVMFSNRCFLPCFLRPNFALSCSLFIRLSIGTVAPVVIFEIFMVETILSSSND